MCIRDSLSFPDAVRFLAKRVNMEVPEDDTDREAARRRQRVLALNRDAARWFYQNLSTPQGAAVAAYLDKRQITRKTAVSFGLGAALDSWDSLLTAMLAKGYSKAELLAAGLVVQNQQGRLYDKFRNRLINCWKTWVSGASRETPRITASVSYTHLTGRSLTRITGSSGMRWK